MLEAPSKTAEIARSNYTPSFVRLGVFRKGSPKEDRTNKKGDTYQVMGQDLGDRFRFEPEIGDRYKKDLLKALITDVLGSAEPTTIRAELMGDTVEDVLFSYYTRHNTAKKMLIQCTGRTVLKEFCDRTKRLLNVNKPCANQDDRLMHCQECQPDSKLHIYIPELSQKTVDLDDGTGYRFFGGLAVVTASMSDGFHLAGRLQGLEVMANSLGMSLNGMPVIITRKAEERSGVDRKPTVKKDGQTIPNPNFMKSFKKKGWFIEIELDTLRWAQKLHKRGFSGDNPFLLSEGEQTLLPQSKEAIAPQKAASNPVTQSAPSQSPSDKFIEVVDALIAKMKDVDMFIKAEDWIVVQDIYKNDLGVQAIVNKKMDTIYKQLSSTGLTESIPVNSQPA